MSKLLKVTVLALLFAVIWSAAGQLHATIGKASYIPKFEPLSYVKSTGEGKLKFTLEKVSDHPQAVWDEVTLTAYGVDLKYKGDTTRLDIPKYPLPGSEPFEYYGDSTWLARFDEKGHHSTTFDLTVPDNDTSCFVLLLEFGESWAFYQGICFVTFSDTLETFRAWPNYWGDLANEREERRDTMPSEEYEPAKREWEERQEQLRRFKGKSTTGPVMNPEDSALVDSLSDKGKRQLGRMRMLERSPLTDEDRQWIVIDNRWFVREWGETKFRRVDAKTKEEIRAEAQRYNDSLAANPPNNAYDVILDLRDSEDYDFVSKLVDSLIPMEKTGYYHTVTTIRVIDEIKQRRIKYAPYPHYPGEIPPPGP